MKISVPWPVNISSQSRIEESLNLWDDKESLIICLAEASDNKFINNFYNQLMPRNSLSIGTHVSKCFICDMVKTATECFLNEDWYGFGNSDIVPVEDLIGENYNCEVIVFHRTDIADWSDRFYQSETDHQMFLDICNMRCEGTSDKIIARNLNRKNIPPPLSYKEWNHLAVKDIASKQGTIFFWGQDLFLFRKDVVKKIIKEYLEVFDPIIGTGAYDLRLTKWLMENFKGVRVLNKIFHKIHRSEWSIDEVEFNHNGGDTNIKDLDEFYGHTYILDNQSKNAYKAAMPRHLSRIINKNRKNKN